VRLCKDRFYWDAMGRGSWVRKQGRLVGITYGIAPMGSLTSAVLLSESTRKLTIEWPGVRGQVLL